MKYNKGFTLIETLVAIFILTLTMGALITLAAQGFFSIRYIRVKYTANQLLQEGLEFVRNDRDSAAQKGKTWEEWTATYLKCTGDITKPSENGGCIVDPYNNYTSGSGTYPRRVYTAVGTSSNSDDTRFDNRVMMYWENATNGFWAQNDGGAVYGSLAQGTRWVSEYRRKIYVTPVAGNPNQIKITGVMVTKQANIDKIYTQSIILTNWNMPQ